MKICFISLMNPSLSQGGANMYAVEIINNLAKIGHEIHLLVPKSNEPRKSLSSKISVLEVPSINIPFFSAITFMISIRIILPTILKRKHFDVIHCNDISGALIPKLSIPVVTTIHHTTKSLSKFLPRDTLLHVKEFRGQLGIIPILEKLAVTAADYIITVSKITKLTLVNLYGINSSKIQVVYNGVSLDFFSSNKIPGQIQRFTANRYVFLYIGRPEKRKGIDVLLEMFRKAIEDNPKLLLIIIGSGSWTRQEKYIRKYKIQRNIQILGRLPRRHLIAWYKACDAVICPSYLEGFGLSVLEGMAAGKPVIAPKWSGVRDLVISAKGGFIVNPHKPKTILNAILHLSRNKKEGNLMGMRNRNFARMHTWLRAANEISEVYEKLISNTK